MCKKSLFIGFIILGFIGFQGCQSDANTTRASAPVHIIPNPTHLTSNIKDSPDLDHEKEAFVLSKHSVVLANEFQAQAIAPLLDNLRAYTGFELPTRSKAGAESGSRIALLSNNRLPEEGYLVEVAKDEIRIEAGDSGGFLYGMATVLQLFPPELYSNTRQDLSWSLPRVSIEDAPRFQWRGLMLDLSRHFFEKDYIKKTIDRLAFHKMNVLHLHLVDDQGWRMEIKKYPKLTSVGAWRVDQEHLHWSSRKPNAPTDTASYGGFLTQDDLKEIVAYAAARNIEVVPEIEMPAHVSSAVAAYPHLSCFEKPIGVPSGSVWPITDIYCAGKESTFAFLEDVLLEVMEIFPSRYIHIGGDEATKTNWEICPHCQRRMKAENLSEIDELQSYFIKRIEKFLVANNRKLIGWDEILEGGLAPEATVMSWRGTKGGLEAAKQGHDVVMSPGSHLYFDHYQGPQNEEPLANGGFTPLSKVYTFDPVVASMSDEEAKHVLGGQANLWAEYIPSTSQSEYMIYPRLSALAEVLWSQLERKDWSDFATRVKTQFKRYEAMGINYAQSAYLVTAETGVDLTTNTVSLRLQNEFPNTDIRYVLGAQGQLQEAIPYTEPIALSKTSIIRASRFVDELPVGKVFVDTIRFHKGVGQPVEYKSAYHKSYQGTGVSTLVNTLRGSLNFHDGQWQGWLEDDLELEIDLGEEKQLQEVIVGSMENQGPDIYFPLAIEIWGATKDGSYVLLGEFERPFVSSANPSLKDFIISFKPQSVQRIKVKAKNLKKSPKGSSSWMFIDEIILN